MVGEKAEDGLTDLVRVTVDRGERKPPPSSTCTNKIVATVC